uniref:Si:ch211-186j3.6 n=1 Tax=Cynoglossus semilaevis TaxID=244447 RepID=A0A3P8UBI6_CYNSE
VASIKVDVLDTNDHQPTFPSAHVRLNLDDSTPLRTTVYAVTASDSDSGKNAELIYFTLPSNGSFYAVPKTGHILLVDSILGLSQPVRFQLFARDRGWPPRTSQSVSVEVYPKQFLVTETKEKVQQSRGTRRTRSALDPDKTLLINVSEDAGIGSVIMNLNPVRFQSATFELVEPADALKSALSVNRDSGDLIITRRLDRETEPLLEITVKVQDKRWYLVRVDLTVTDVNDNTPEWSMVPVPYLAVVSTDAAAGSVVYKLQAEDGDEGNNGEVEYFLSEGDGRFEVDRKNGHIRTTGLPLQRDKEYLLTVIAADRLGSRSPPAVVSVVAGARPPQFTNASFTIAIPENTPEAQFLVTPAVSFQKKPISYSLLINPSSLFSISAETGEICLTRTIDYESDQHRYLLLVRASEGVDSMSSAAEVRVVIVDENDCVPEFLQSIYSKEGVPETVTTATSLLQYRTFVSEDAGPNTLVATVLAKDPDGDGITYKISTGNEEGNFVIDNQKLIRLRSSPPPRLQGVEYILNVTATDDNSSGGPQPLSSTAQVIVGVDDVNNNKPVFEKYRESTSVLENQPAGTFVLQVHAVDADEGSNGKVTYGFMHKDSTVPAFSIHPDTGVMVTARKFDRERQREYAVTVTATDQAGDPLIGICQLNIFILDENDNSPKFENIRYEFLREDTMIGTSFLRVAAHDDDFGTNAAITYSMSNEEPEYLRVNPLTGWVFVNQPISQRTYITRDIMATDGGNQTSSVELAVTITNVKNQPPHWEKDSYSVVIAENTVRDTPVVTIKATSPLGDPRVTYNLEDGLVPETNLPVRFYLTPNREDGSASILVAEPLDYETTRNFMLKVRAQNVAAVPLAAFTTVYVNVTISYSLLEDRSGDHKFFRIDPELGFIYTQTVFDREAKSSYLLEVKSVDGSESARPGKHGQPNSQLHLLASDGKWEDYTTVTVNVVNKNDEAPVFTVNEYYGSVTEELDGSPVFVLQVTATDPDKGADPEALRYSLHGQGSEGEFIIDEVTGRIYAQRTLDREERAVWRFVVLATDEGGEGLTGFTDVIINVWDINDNAPVFTCAPSCQGEVLENSPAGTSVMEMTATDLDDAAVGQNAVLSYRVVGSLDVTNMDLEEVGERGGVPTFSEMFTINPTTGTITVAISSLDREQVESYLLVVEARDGGRLPTTVLGKVYAPDPDDWDNKTYVFEGHVPYFILNKRTGFLIVKENTPPGTYQFQVQVSDGIWPDAVSKTTVYVRELREEAVHNSASLRLTITAKEFMELRGKQRSRYDLLNDFLSEMLSVPAEDINIFSLMDKRDRMLDIRFAVYTGLSFLRSEKIHGYLAAHKQKLQSFLQVSVSHVQVDECPSSECSGSGGCSTVLNVRDTPTVVDCGSMSLVSITVESTAVCSCTGREQSHQSCASYPRNPCFNGGVCVDTQHGYCHCPAQFEGPECQQNRRSFHGSGYAWFPPMIPCFESHISLEFITDVPDGLLLYSGPLAQLQTWDHEDFMAILIDGTPTLKINHGSGTVVLQLPSNVNVADRRWHRLDIRSNSKLYDLGSPADFQSSLPGCATTDNSCVNMGYPSCGQQGRCQGEWGSFSCQCVPGFTGHQVREYSFDGHSHVHYQLASPLPARRTSVQVLVRTRKHNSTILNLISKEKNEYLKVECMKDLRLNGRYIPLESQPRDGVSQVSVQGLSLGCLSDSCKKNQCKPPFTCVDLWRVHECCPPGHMIRVNGSRRTCVYTLCATRPCHHGTCVAQSPSKFTCQCPEGYRGRHCETPLAIYREDVGLSFSSLFAIVICFMALLVLLLGIFLYNRWRSYKGLKEGVYHVSAHHDGWEDIRENVLNYDEEGGGEEDQNAYDMAELQKSLQPSPAQSVQYCRSRALHHPPPQAPPHHHHLLHQTPPAPPTSQQPLESLSRTTSSTTLPQSVASTTSTNTTTGISVRRDIPPTRLPPQGQTRSSRLSHRSLSFSSQDLARYLCEIIRDADQHPDTGPFDSLQVFSTEGGGSPAGSLSSFSSSILEGAGDGGGEGRREETLGDWGPRFEKLRALYEHAESSNL